MGDQTCTNDAMKKILGNMTSEMQNIDGQYVPLGFIPPQTVDSVIWNQPQNTCRYNVQSSMDQYPSAAYDFIPPPPPNVQQHAANPLEFDMYNSMQNGPNMVNYLLQSQHEQQSTSSHRTQLIENLVGNWVIPNNSGTYSPFGTSDSFLPNVFDIQTERSDHNNVMNQINDDTKYIPPPILDHPTMEDRQFQFNRDTRKPRMVAEVKPMRPSYSDVLTKAVPQTTLNTTKLLKNDNNKESKPKKDNKKLKNDSKSQKMSITRSNTNNDIKDINGVDKMHKNDKSIKSKTTPLSRKWASLDNISEPMMKNGNKSDDSKKKRIDDTTVKNNGKFNSVTRKLNKTVNDVSDTESSQGKSEISFSNKNGVKKSSSNFTKVSSRQKATESFGSAERPPGKRNQRTRKRDNNVPFGFIGQKLKQYTKGWWRILTVFAIWLFNLISDICSLSLHLSSDLSVHLWSWLNTHCSLLLESTVTFLKHVRLFTWIWEKFKGRKKSKTEEENTNFVHKGLQNNINMPTTGDEAMKRLLACKGKDPYSILGVTPTCTDDDIKRYYKKQAFLVHPDKNQQPGAEEAFKILVHAFDMIGEPERRASYDRGVVESAQVVQAWSEFTELLEQLQEKVATAANTIRCSTCGSKHKRFKVDRPCYAARNCSQCKIHHAAREGDIWAEARVLGFLWHYYACMEGGVYDITEWAGCQKDNLKQIKPDSHHVQYRIALGKQTNQGRRHTAHPRHDRPDLENLLNTLYGQNDSSYSSQNTSRRRNKRK